LLAHVDRIVERDEASVPYLRAVAHYRRIVSIADDLLGRNGRMVDAISSIGAGLMAQEATPFRLDLE
jgi:predicted protein tyrosine phosphatase